MSPVNSKKLINFTPQYYTTTVAAAVASFQTTPIDGILLDFRWTSPTFGASSQVQKTWLHADLMAWSDFATQVAAFQAITWGNLTDNFVRLRLQPGYSNATEFWNDPAMIASATNNIGLVARAAREVGARGIMFDWEAYTADIQHRMLKSADLKVGFTLAQRKAQVRAAMANICAAIWANFPDCVVFLMFGYEEMYSSSNYDLLGSAIEGIMDVSPITKIGSSPSLFHIVNGLENTYYADTSADWEYWYNSIFEAHRAAGGTFHPKYAENISVGSGIWLDRVATAPYNAFSLVDFTWNYFDPVTARAGHASWQQVVGQAFDRVDSFVWLFTENNAGYLGMPTAYKTATEDAATAHRTLRTDYQHHCLMVVTAVGQAAANAACVSIGMDPIFTIPLVDFGDAPGTAPKRYMANVTATEAEYRGLRVMVGAAAALTVSGEGDYSTSYQESLWLFEQGWQLSVEATCDPCTCLNLYYQANEAFKKAVLVLLCYINQTITYIANIIGGITPPSTNAVFTPLVAVSLLGQLTHRQLPYLQELGL